MATASTLWPLPLDKSVTGSAESWPCANAALYILPAHSFPHRLLLRVRSPLEVCMADRSAAATRERTFRFGVTACADGTLPGLAGAIKPHSFAPRFAAPLSAAQAPYAAGIFVDLGLLRAVARRLAHGQPCRLERRPLQRAICLQGGGQPRQRILNSCAMSSRLVPDLA